MNQKKYYRSSELKQRGWTDGLIKKFLPKPDETKTNPVIKSAAPMKLYKIKRVERIEKSEKFIKEMENMSTPETMFKQLTRMAKREAEKDARKSND